MMFWVMLVLRSEAFLTFLAIVTIYVLKLSFGEIFTYIDVVILFYIATSDWIKLSNVVIMAFIYGTTFDIINDTYFGVGFLLFIVFNLLQVYYGKVFGEDLFIRRYVKYLFIIVVYVMASYFFVNGLVGTIFFNELILSKILLDAVLVFITMLILNRLLRY